MVRSFVGSEDTRGEPSGERSEEKRKGELACFPVFGVFSFPANSFFEGAAICCGLGGGVCKFVGCV